METIDVKADVRKFIVDNFVLGSKKLQLNDADSFMARHIVDSTGFLELVTFLEETYGIAVADEEMVPENLDSLIALEAFIGRKLGA